MLLAQSPVELLSIQLKRLPAVGAEERWYLAVVGGLEKDGKGCWTLCLAEGVRSLPLYTGVGLERAPTSQSRSVTNTPSDLMFDLLNVKKKRAQPSALFSG